MFKSIKTHLFVLINLFVCIVSVYGTDTDNSSKEQKKESPKDKEPLKEEVVTTSHSVRINGVDVAYKANVGTQLLLDSKGVCTASIFYIAYTRDNISDNKTRPITFCFNGGPGTASVWLHLGVFGPRRVSIDEEGKGAKHPYHLVDNPYSLLDVSDLVFIDPVSTGYSRAVEDAKQFHGVNEDIRSIAEFIRLYTTRNLRWESPKFLAGESYGTTRAAGLALELHDGHHLDLEGIILLSAALNFQTIKMASGNDLPFILYLPTYTSTALYHKKLSPELQKDEKKTMDEVKQFALGEYASALMQGDKLPEGQRRDIEDRLVQYTGLPKDYVERTNLRINDMRFAKELLRTERRTVGRFDSRLKGMDPDLCGNSLQFDPSFENILGLFGAVFNDYVRAELNWKRDEEYKILTDVSPWNYRSENEYLNVGEDLREVINRTTDLRVFVGSGYYDLAIPFMATEYTFSHLNLDPSLRNHVVLKNYYGGHMMYLYQPTLIELKTDLFNFLNHRE